MPREDPLHSRVLRRLAGWPGWDTVRAALDACPEVEVHVAGGLVRDDLLGLDHDPRDVDFFLGGDQGPLLERLASLGDLGQGPFGAPRWLPRVAGAAHCDLVSIRSFVNGLWPCEDMVDVLNQFDFTAGAVAVNLRTGEVRDPQNGRRDAARRVLRAVRFDYPEEPIRPGHGLTRPAVVWFRLLHYAARLGLTIEPVTLAWLREGGRFASGRAVFEREFFPLHPGWSDPVEVAG